MVDEGQGRTKSDPSSGLLLLLLLEPTQVHDSGSWEAHATATTAAHLLMTGGIVRKTGDEVERKSLG